MFLLCFHWSGSDLLVSWWFEGSRRTLLSFVYIFVTQFSLSFLWLIIWREVLFVPRFLWSMTDGSRWQVFCEGVWIPAGFVQSAHPCTLPQALCLLWRPSHTESIVSSAPQNFLHPSKTKQALLQRADDLIDAEEQQRPSFGPDPCGSPKQLGWGRFCMFCEESLHSSPSVPDLWSVLCLLVLRTQTKARLKYKRWWKKLKSCKLIYAPKRQKCFKKSGSAWSQSDGLHVWPWVTSCWLGFKDIIPLHNVVTRKMALFAAASPPAAADLQQRLPTQKVAVWWNEGAEWPRWAIMRPAQWFKSRQPLQHTLTVRVQEDCGVSHTDCSL